MNIDLGRKIDCSVMCCPAPEPSKDSKVTYPSLYIEGGSELRQIPTEGVIKLRYRTARRSEIDRDGKKRTELELEAIEILGAESESAPKSREANLDSLRDEVTASDDEYDSEEE